MSILTRLQKFNIIALSVVLVVVLSGMIFAALETYRSWRFDDQRTVGNFRNEPSATGERIVADDHIVMLLANGSPHAEFQTDVRLVDGRNGSAIRLSDDPNQPIYGGTIVGQPKRSNTSSGYGYVALAKTGAEGDKPQFDLTFVRFSDMKVFKLASKIRTFDVAMELDGKSFSAIIEGSDDKLRFVIINSEFGRIVKELDLDSTTARQPAAASDAASKAKFR